MRLSNKLKYLLPSLITALLYFTVLFIKGIYPFGNLTVDYYDMAQQIAAFYYHIYDVLHGTKALFIDPYTAMSVNMAMSTSGCSHLSLFNLFFLFIKRNMLLESLSFFLGLKMLLMSLTMYIYLHKERKLPYLFEVMFSVGYSFCGFVMVLYVTIQWMDIAVLFPLIMLFYHKLIREGRSIGYIITLSLSIIASYYISFMILIFIVLFTGLELSSDYIFERNNPNRRKLHLTELFFETLISIFLSLFILVPQLKQTLMSARFTNESAGGPFGMYMNIINTVTPAYTTRWFSLLGLSFAFAVIVAGIIRNRKNKKILFLSLMTLLLMLSELFIESINLIWHFGSYVQYPIRNGFMIYFAVTLTAAYFIESSEIKLSGFSHIVICAVVMIFALSLGIKAYNNAGQMPVRTVFHILALIMLLSFVISFVCFIYSKGKMAGMLPVIVAAELIFYGFVFIGHPTFVTGYSEEPEQEGEYIRICNQISEKFNINPDDNYDYLLSRIKNPDESLNANYGLVLRKPTLSNWTHLLNPGLSDTAKKMGYSVQFTRLLDAGGTVFSDALIGVNNIITTIPQNEALYTLLDSKELVVDSDSLETRLYYLYESKYKLPFGYIFSEEINDLKDADTVELYNSIYNAMGGQGEIASWLYNDKTAENSVVSKKLGSLVSFSYTCQVTEKKALYYVADQVDTDDYNTEIRVDNEKLLIPSIKEENNTLYPAHFNNNAVFLGVYENEFVKVDASFSRIGKNGEDILSSFSPKVLAIDLNKLEDLCKEKRNSLEVTASKNKYEYNLSANSGDKLILPLSYDKGYYAVVNGKKIKPDSFEDMFISIPLYEGQNKVEISFLPDGLKPGAIISLVTLLLLILLLVIDKKKKILFEIPYIDKICLAGYCLVIACMYVIPIFYGVYKCII